MRSERAPGYARFCRPLLRTLASTARKRASLQGFKVETQLISVLKGLL